MYQDVSGYSQNLISNAVGMAGKCILIEGETVYNAVVIGMFSAIVASITYAVSMAAAKLTMTLGTYMKEVCTANFTYITGAEKSIEDMIIIFPAAEVANDIEIFPETEQVPVWEILTVPPAKGTDVMITIPGTVDVPNGIIIDFPIPQNFGDNVVISENGNSEIKKGDKTSKGRQYTGHAAKRANERGFDSQKIDSIIENNYNNRVKEVDRVTGEVTWRYQDKRGNTVITNEWGDNIVTVYSYPKFLNKGNYIPKN